MRTNGARRLLAVLAIAMVVTGLTLPGAPVAQAAVTSVLSIEKSASTQVVVPGETFEYTIVVGCSSITDVGCRDAVLTDLVPPEFELLSAAVGGLPAAEPVIDGQNLLVTFTADLGDGTTGLLDATTGTVSLTVRARDDLPFEAGGVRVLNNAVLVASNADPVDAEAAVTPQVELALAVSGTKAIDPETALAVPGSPVTATIGAQNTSNAAVDRLVIVDPADPDATPNPFEALALTGFSAVAPEGATGTTHELYVDGVWLPAPNGTIPAGVDPATIRGVRTTFTGSIPAGASGSLALALEHTGAVLDLPDGATITNTAGVLAGLGDAEATGRATAAHTVRQNVITVSAAKSFDPTVVVAGEPSTVALSGTNTSTLTLESLTIAEPATGAFEPGFTFNGFTSGADYPATATSGSVTYLFAGGTSETLPFADGAVPPPPTRPLAEVSSFETTFEGSIVPGGTGSLSFELLTDADLADLPVTLPNEVGVVGTNAGATGEDTATADLYVYDQQLGVHVDKQIRPGQILAVPGESVTVSLTGGTTDRPNPSETPEGSTADAHEVILQDPADPAADDWWNAFDATGIRQTPIPDGATLTVRYWDVLTSAWVDLFTDVAGGTIFSAPIDAALQDRIGGLQFVYLSTEGFPPGTDFAPNFSSELRTDARDGSGPAFDAVAGGTVANCAASSGSIGGTGTVDATAEMAPGTCPEVELIPVDPGTVDLIDKNWLESSSGGDASVIARSGDTIPARLTWSTGGFSNLSQVQVTDVADPSGTPIADSVFDAFDLIRLVPITPATDPLITYDEVSQVLLFNGSAWVGAANDPCPQACQGTFPGLTLTVAEQQTTVGVRLVFAERGDRADVIGDDLDAPAPGSGVARSFGNDRPIDLVFRVRDLHRDPANPGPVLGTDVYNLDGQNGVVHNTANATGIPADGGTPISADDSDDVIIIDVPLTTVTDKNWTGGPLSVPGQGIPASSYPLSRMIITTRNTTPARVDSMTILDPAPGSSTDPFNAFSFNRFVQITEPGGTTSTTVTLSFPDGTSQDYTRTEALALTAAALPGDVIGVQVRFDGRVGAGAAGVVNLEVRLRPVFRDGTGPVTPAASPVLNEAEGAISDLGGADGHTATDLGDASIALAEPSFSVETTKTIEAAAQKEGDDAPVTVTISGQPGGSTRATQVTLTDDDASFWNAFDFVGISESFSLTAPIGLVQIDYLAGGTFTATGDGGLSVTGGTWTDGTPLTLAEAMAYAATLPDDLHGLRFTFWRDNGLGWDNPANPLQSVPFQVQRRAELRTGDPVPTTRSDEVPAPGETEAGQFWNTVEADARSVDIGTGDFLTAEDSADAEYRYLHLLTEVAVAKSPTGVLTPGRVIPFTLDFTNFGESALTNPVFTDHLPTDANGSMLVFDPDADPTVSPYRFELTGAAPDVPSGTPLPTAVDDVEVTGDPATGSIVFSMPPGSVLEPGQTYRITISLMLRPGLTPADLVTNVAAVIADEPFDECSVTLDPATGECRDDTTVWPLDVPALSSVKYVRAEQPHGEAGLPEVISDANRFDCTGRSDAEGFYRAPCIPVTLPGGTEVWRFVVTNSGTLPVDQVVAVDHLPVPDDQGLIVALPRQSTWTPQFLGGVRLVPRQGSPAGASLTTFYTTSETPCTADLNPLGTACTAGSWLPLTADVAPETVRSLKFVIDYPQAPLSPGMTATIEFETSTTPAEAVSTDYPIAWNTVAVGGAAISGAGPRVAVPPTEGRRVGVTYPTGAVEFVKTVTGAGAAFAPETFEVVPVCTSAGVTLTDLPPLTLTPGQATPLSGLPWGAECTATEADNGQIEYTAGTAVVGGPTEPAVTVGIENVFALASLLVTKEVSGALDSAGEPVAYGPFTVTVTCTFLGASVTADGYPADEPMEVTLEDGGSALFTGLPAGAACTVTETDAAGAELTELLVTTAAGAGDPVAGTEAVVVLTPVDPQQAPTASVAISNGYAVGSLEVTKTVAGPGASDYGTGPFLIHVTCTLDDASSPRTVWDGDIVLGGDAPLAHRIEAIAAGAECTVTETDAAGADVSLVEPGGPVLIEADAPAAASVINTFLTGSLQVVKERDGDGADRYGVGPFEVLLECTVARPDGPLDVQITGGATRELTADNDYEARYASLPNGATCVLTETATGGATSTAILTPDGQPLTQITIEDGVAAEAVVVNTYEVGAITVTKRVLGPAPEGAEYTVSAVCTLDVNGVSTQVPIPGGADRVLSDATSLTTVYDDLPVGAECEVRESDTGGAARSTLTPNTGDRAVAVVGVAPGADAVVEVLNEFDPPLATTPPLAPGADGWDPAPPAMATTGAEAQSVAAAAIALLVLGAVALVLSRRRIRS
ncbi:DUF5979 domain-containing protein [Occultella kanbiaonis]|uniref:DUF5979 domain-containing protein n=1 Tax=Occultella kanbiaonis TaxID=2675754 RepID=UPI0013D6ED84|nr:DUF5979 domain-containing protein [Occultella kanbiaonis]